MKTGSPVSSLISRHTLDSVFTSRPYVEEGATVDLSSSGRSYAPSLTPNHHHSKSFTVPECEACGLTMGLAHALENGYNPIRCRGDNLGIISQTNGNYRTSWRWNADHLRPLIERLILLSATIRNLCQLPRNLVFITWAKRDKNKEADNVCTYAIVHGDRIGIHEALPAPVDPPNDLFSYFLLYIC
jgi:ribonuclease HI